MKPVKILFITHDATITGAPILLLNLIGLLLNLHNGKYEIKIIVKNGIGNFIYEFQKIAPTLIWRKPINNGFFKRLLSRFISPNYFCDIKIQQWINESDIVFSNTITNGDFFEAFQFPSSVKLITYVHELEIATRYYTSPHYLKYVLQKSHFFLVPSRAVLSHLVKNLNVLSEKILPLHYFIPFEKLDIKDVKTKEEDEFSVGFVGTLDWRKGADILPLLLQTFFKKYSNTEVRFKWQGASESQIEYIRIEYELQKLGLSDKVTFLKPIKDMTSFYQSIDVLLLISKEDPYPLVVLEAASNGKPCICFDKAGGAPEFVSNNAGTVVPYLDLETFCDAIYTYYTDSVLLSEHGRNAMELYKQLHLNKELISSEFDFVIQ